LEAGLTGIQVESALQRDIRVHERDSIGAEFIRFGSMDESFLEGGIGRSIMAESCGL